MTRPTKRDVERAVDDLEDGAVPVDDVADAFALLVAVASETASPAEVERWRQLPEDFKQSLVGPHDTDAAAGDPE